MAATDAGAALTVAYRIQQERTVRDVLRRLLQLWPLLDINDIDGTAAAFVAAATDLTLGGRQLTAAQALDYVIAYRLAEGAAGSFPTATIGPAQVAAIETAIRVTGPVALKRGIKRGIGGQLALENAFVQVSGAVTRNALAGGREQITTTVAADRAALGWARITSGRPCAFCAMLAGRGPVYRSKGTADFQPHDHCHCSPEPIYHQDAAWTDQARRYRELYDAAAAGAGGPHGKYNAFRKALSAADGYAA